MSYEKLGFEKGQVLKAEHLNHMEEGITNACGVTTFYWDDGEYIFSDPERTKKVSKDEYLSAMTGLILIDYYGETYSPVITIAYDDMDFAEINILVPSPDSCRFMRIYTSEFEQSALPT
jgi:hypothetical protein